MGKLYFSLISMAKIQVMILVRLATSWEFLLLKETMIRSLSSVAPIYLIMYALADIFGGGLNGFA